jgi:ribosomal-protein-alanine N-acetyltransferase
MGNKSLDSAQLVHNMRSMTQFDIDPVMAIELKAYDFPWTKGIIEDCLRVGYHCFAYEVNNEIRGYGILSTVLDEAHLLNICIAPEYQNQGLGFELMTYLMGFARTRNAKTLYLEVRISNKAAIHLYQTMGFNELGVRENYYPAKKGREDAQLFACELI